MRLVLPWIRPWTSGTRSASPDGTPESEDEEVSAPHRLQAGLNDPGSDQPEPGYPRNLSATPTASGC